MFLEKPLFYGLGCKFKMDGSTTFKLINEKDIQQSIIHKVTYDSSHMCFIVPAVKYEYKVWNGVDWKEYDELQKTIEVKDLDFNVCTLYPFVEFHFASIKFSDFCEFCKKNCNINKYPRKVS